MVAWARATYQYHVNGTDTVGRSVDARGPIDHTSMGLAQARPNQKCTQDFIVNVNAKHEKFFPVIISRYILAMCFVRRF